MKTLLFLTGWLLSMLYILMHLVSAIPTLIRIGG